MSDNLINGHLVVNGQEMSVRATERQTLLEFLRDDLGLTGTKNGCAKGHCGACTVIIDGQAKRACLLRMSRLDGASVETIEGLAKDGELHLVQRAFIDSGAVACGFW